MGIVNSEVLHERLSGTGIMVGAPPSPVAGRPSETSMVVASDGKGGAGLASQAEML